jgi:transposase InsO family protein
MRIKNWTIPRASRLVGKLPTLSRETKLRLKWMDYYHTHSCNASLTCRHFGIARQTFYRWKRRYDPDDLRSLEDRSHRPKHIRKPTWSGDMENTVLSLRLKHPRWGKDKLAPYLRERGMEISNSMVGRILTKLKVRGVLKEPLRNTVCVNSKQRKRPYAIRKPKGYRVKRPGDMVQVDTLDIRPVPGMVLKHFTARDVVSRWDVVEAHTRATSNTASMFLESLIQRTPFTVRAIQVDGGSEFQSSFEEACRDKGIMLFVLPPRSPKLNGYVERAHRTHLEEFYEVEHFSLDVATLNQELMIWERVYNTVRPHQALGYLTPQQFLLQSSLGKDHVLSLSKEAQLSPIT